MDSAYKNQILAKIGNTIGNNITPTPTHSERDTIFLLTQYIADTMENLKQSIDTLTNAVNTINSNLENVNNNITNINTTLTSVVTSFDGNQNFVRVAEPISNGTLIYWVSE